MRRLMAVVATALVWLVALAAPAAAHSGAGEGASNYRSRLLSVTPEVPGLEIEVIENGDRLQVTNNTGRDVVVLGYQGEPYLRIGPDGVAENLLSPATYLNRDRQAATAVPGSADPAAEPEWSQTSDTNTARWHDHRAHWMGAEEPEPVRQAPGERHTVIPEWTVTMLAGDSRVEASGDVVWIPGPSPLPWLALAAALCVGTVVAGLSRVWRPAIAVAVGLLVVSDVVHAAGVGFVAAEGLGSQVVQILSGSLVSVIGWIAGGVGLGLVLRGHAVGLATTAFAGILMAFNGGIAHLGDLDRSQIVFAGSTNMARATTVVALGVGLGLFVACCLQQLRSQEATAIDPQPDGIDRIAAGPAIEQPNWEHR